MPDERSDRFALPAIGLGTMRLQGNDCESLVDAALAEGYRHLDTARRYGNEAAVGAGIRRSSVPRDDIVVTTKIWFDELSPEEVEAAAVESLARLCLDYVDLLLIHWPSRTVPVQETLASLTELREQGMTRFIGVANFPSALLAEVASTPGMVGNQVEFHPYLAQDAVLSVVREHGLTLTAYCPLGRDGTLLADETVRAVADDCGRTPAQIILRWLIQQDSVVAIPGTSSVQHLRDNFAVHDFELAPEQMERISALAHGARVVDPPHAPLWDPEGTAE